MQFGLFQHLLLVTERVLENLPVVRQYHQSNIPNHQRHSKALRLFEWNQNKTIIFMLQSTSSFSSHKYSSQPSEPNRSFSSLETKIQQMHFGSQRYARFMHEQKMRERAKKFITRIKHQKSINQGMFLAKKQELQRKRYEQEEELSREKQKEKEESRIVYRNRVLTKIKEQRQARSLKKLRFSSLKHLKRENTETSESTPRFNKEKVFAKRFKTVPKSEPVKSLPPIKQLRHEDKAEKTRESRMKEKREELLYLPSNLRIKILSVNQKLRQLNSMNEQSQEK